MRRFLYFFIPFILMVFAELIYINYRLNNVITDLELKQDRIEKQFISVENEAISLTVKYTLLRERFNEINNKRSEPVLTDSRLDSSHSSNMILVSNY